MPPPSESASSSSTASSPQSKRQKTASLVDVNEKSPHHAAITALPPPIITCAPPSSSATPILPTTDIHPLPSTVAYFPVYTTHAGHFYIASPPLHPTSSTQYHPTKILPKLTPNHHQAPPTPVTLPTSPSSSSAPYNYYHPYQVSPPIQPIHPSTFAQHYSPQTSATTTTADQREQARKVSHSAIERRRRERINDKIMQLKQLIPTCADQENLHKMSVLQSAIEYITYLKQILEKDNDDDNEDPPQGQSRPIKLNWDLKKNDAGVETPTTASMLEPYMSQFNTQQKSPSASASASSSNKTDTQQQQQQQQCLKPMDIFMSKNTKESASIPSSSVVSTPESVSNATSSSSKSSSLDDNAPNLSMPPKNMSLKNILC
ncbi:hypothetical protein BCR42DRAFT_425839 [Absidia repens]|uniref:BHLH domain-containing protein n=1 Tax=Absidia repens TaxID=90262 RepID=A0A1X2I1U5_9FUNG|nr:hypothetical protein BCR42DRAFT_425839 [Absidia repens]